MKKTKLSLILSGLVIAMGIVIVSCKKSTSTTTTPDTSTTSSTDNNTAQQSSQDITNFGSQGIDNGSLSTYRTHQGTNVFAGVSGTATVIVTGTKQIQVTFINFVGYDGITRNGTIQYDWSASTAGAVYYKDSGLVLNITTPSNNYTIKNNSTNVTSTVTINSKQIKNIGRIGGQLTWTDNSNITITQSTGGTPIQWQGNWTIALLNTSAYSYVAPDAGSTTDTSYGGVFHGYGSSNPFISWPNAVIGITGNFNGTASDGETYAGNISNQLVLNFNCHPIFTKYLYVAGTLNFTPTGKTTRTINYGTGTCDLTYTITIGSFSVTITL